MNWSDVEADDREREKAFREIAEALLSDRINLGSCCGCSNIGHDALLDLKRIFPDDLPYVRRLDRGIKDRKAAIVEEGS